MKTTRPTEIGDQSENRIDDRIDDQGESQIVSLIDGAAELGTVKPRRRRRLRRQPRRFFIVAAGLALLASAWGAATAVAQNDRPTGSPPDRPASTEPGDTAHAYTSYEECVEAALAAFGQAEAASSGAGHDGRPFPEAPGDAGERPHKPGGSGPATEPPTVVEPHPNSPAHEWCTVDCPEDEQCARPGEFTVVRDDDVSTISFENPDPQGGPAS